PIDVVDLVLDRCRGRQRGRNGGREVARGPGSAFGVDVDTQPSRVFAAGLERSAVASSSASLVDTPRSSAPPPDGRSNTVVCTAAPPAGSIVSESLPSFQEGTMRPMSGALSLVPLRTTAASGLPSQTTATVLPPSRETNVGSPGRR